MKNQAGRFDTNRDNEIRFKKINKCRIEAGLPPMVIKNKTCLKCQNEFKSFAVANRLCDLCLQIRTYESRAE